MAAEVVDHEQFLLADGDFVFAAEFALPAVEPLAEGVSMRVWRARNPVSALVYGYGGLKLIRRSSLRELGEAVDVLAVLPGRIEFTGDVAGTTRPRTGAHGDLATAGRALRPGALGLGAVGTGGVRHLGGRSRTGRRRFRGGPLRHRSAQ
ncbi:hypothetical protein [Streptomyces sp. NPDC058457]|uniref:hypothetical protein n=1 Tax=Streptomyces sp. NPDC058457 TaxID=3346507 RepID=UPI0036687F2B